MDADQWLVVGLGNPGPGYAANRHNLGHMVLDVLAERAGVTFKRHRANAMIAETRIAQDASGPLANASCSPSPSPS